MEKRLYTDPTGDQLRAARAWLRWSLEEASEASGVHRQTIHKVEAGQSRGTRDTIKALVRAHAANGIWLDKGAMTHEGEQEAED